MSRTLGIVVLALLPAAQASAAPFEGDELFVGRYVKQDKEGRVFTLGINVKAAPMDFALSKVRDDMIDDAIAGGCNGDADCESAARQAWKELENVPASDWDALQDAVSQAEDNGNYAQLEGLIQQTLVNRGMDPQDAALGARQITDYAKDAPNDLSASEAIGIARSVAEAKANVLLEPFFNVNLDLVELRAAMPFVITVFDDHNEFGLGNFATDVKFGRIWDYGPVSIGLSGGAELYFPTGTSKSSAAAYADLFEAPKYMHEYLTWAPHVEVGVEVPVVTLQASGEFVNQHKVRSSPRVSMVNYFKYGVGVTILPKFLLSIIGEINGLVPIHNASSYNALFGVGGVRLNIVFMRIGVAVQAPIYNKAGINLPPIGGVPVDKLSDLSGIVRVAFAF